LEGYPKVSKGNLVNNIMLMWKKGLGVSDYKGIVSPAYSVFEFNDSTPKYFHYLLRTDLYIAEYRKNSTGIINSRLRLYDDDFGNIFSFLPPLPEQKQIVSFLDQKTQKIDELIGKTEQKIGLLKEKRISLINHCVTKGLNPNAEMKDSGVESIGEIPIGWSMRKGSTIGLYSKGSGISKDEVKDSGIPCIRYGEIYTIYDRVVFSTKSFISEKSTDNCVRVSKGSVLLTGSGETVEDIGKCVVYMGESDIYIGGDIIIIDLVGEIQPLFMSYLMNSECIRIQKSLLGRGEIIVHIYPKNIREIQYPIPPLPEQKQIVEYVDEQTQKIDTTVKKETKRIDLLKEYRQSLISEAVTGKIDVRNDNG